MVKIALRGVRAHLVKFLLSVLAVTLGVAFVTGTLSLRQMLSSTFDEIVSTSVRADVYVQPADSEQTTGAQTSIQVVEGIPVDLVDDIAKIDGVRVAVAEFQGSATLIGADGTAVQSAGPPSYAIGFDSNSNDGFTLDGQAPKGHDEVLLEATAMERSGLKIGDKTDLLIGGQLEPVTVVGSLDWGGATGGATLMFIDAAWAQEVFAPDNRTSSIAVYADPDVSPTELADDLTSLAASQSGEVITGDKLREEAQEAVEDSLGFISTFLLIFAALALFVGAFIIANTFAMTIRQQLREYALLRAMGASPGQIFGSIVVQAFVIGLVGSGLGIVGGLGLMGLLQVFFSSMDMNLGNAVLTMPTVITGVLIGTIVTMVASVLPARRAALVPPVEAMRDEVVIHDRGTTIWAVVGALLLAGGIYSGWAATQNPGSDNVGWMLAGAAGGVLLGVLALGPVLVPAVIQVLAIPAVGLIRPLGRLARGNVTRNPRRTSNTAGALTIGMALVGAASVLAASTQASVASMVTSEIRSDFALSAGQMNAVPAEAVAEVSQLDSVDQAYSLAYVLVMASTDAEPSDSDGTILYVMEPDTLGNAMLPREEHGDAQQALASGQVAVDTALAEDRGWKIGDDVNVVTASGRETYEIGATLHMDTMGESLYIAPDTISELVPASQQQVVNVLVTAADGTSLEDLRADLVRVVKPYVVVSVQDSDEYVSSFSDQIDQMLTILYALLGLSVLIAGLGIINTLALSVIERTREIGLLRAVGLGRLQLSTTVMIESVLTAVAGTAIGLAAGVGIATIVPIVYADQGLSELSIPWVQLANIVGIGMTLGVLAAVWPATRAARLKVLDAISYE